MKDSQTNRADIDRVRTALQAAAPPDVANAGRAEEVVRRGRQAASRRGMASVAAVGLAAAAIVIGPHFIDGSPVTKSVTEPANGTQTSATKPSPRDPYADPCPATPVTVPDRPSSNFLLQPDTVMVRLCRAQGGGVSSPWRPPADGLVNEVDGFAARVAQLPRSSVDPCPAARAAPSPFALQVTDSTGASRTVSSMLTRCGTVTVNSNRVSADTLLGAFRESLLQQRQALRTSVSNPQPLSCGEGKRPIMPTWHAQVTLDTQFIGAAVCRPPRQVTPRVSSAHR